MNHIIKQVTNECFEWCKEQNFIHHNNLTVEGLSIVVIAMIALFLYVIYEQFGEFMLIDDKITRYIRMIPEFSLYLLMGFIIWYLYTL